MRMGAVGGLQFQNEKRKIWLMALMPGLFFGISNAAQSIWLAADWLNPNPLLATCVFVVVFGLMAPAIVAGLEFLRWAHQSPPSFVHMVLATFGVFAAAALHLALISLVVSWVRVPNDMWGNYTFFLNEILVACLPIWLAVFALTIAIIDRLALRNGASSESPIGRLLLREGTNANFIDPSDLLYAMSDGNYLHVVTKHRSFFVRHSLTEFLESLSAGEFVRTHRCAVAKVSEISSVQRKPTGSYVARLKCGAEIPLSRLHKKAIQERLV